MTVNVKLYAPFSFALGKKELTMEIPGKETVTVEDFLRNLTHRERRLQKLTERDNNPFTNLSVIVDEQVLDSSSIIKDGDRVSILSPVSGG